MISALHINKSFGTLQVLKDICFTASGAEVVSIVGASGAGKSTLLQILGSLSKPDSGRVEIDGVDIYSLSSAELARFRNRKIGFVFQFNNLLPEFTAQENVMMPALIGGTSLKEARSKADELLEAVGLSGRATHKPSQLSGGEQQRVAIARALINTPAVLFADEPTGNLDSRTKDEIHQLLLNIRKERDQTVIVVTHDAGLASLCDRTCLLLDGAWR